MKLKRIFAAFAAAALCGLTGCAAISGSSGANNGSSNNNTTNNGMPASPGVLRGVENLVTVDRLQSDKTYTIGISRLVDHAALNLSEEGFVAALSASGFVIGENLIIEYRNGQGSEAALAEIADEFVDKNVDLIFAIATPAAQACANKTSSIPIIATAVTDFMNAGLVDSNSRPGRNVSGTTDMSPVEEQIGLMTSILPDVETVGFFYTASESNSALQVKLAREYAESKGLATVTETIDTADDIESVLTSLSEKCDAVYIPTDNLLASEMAAVNDVAIPLRLPVFCAESGMVESGGVATLGLDYYDLGYQAGLMAVRVLDGSAIDRMSIQKSSKFEYCFNRETLDALGITLPEQYQRYLD